MKALIIVDMQFDFLPGGQLSVPRGDEIIPAINGLLDRYDLVVATQDWHPKDHKSFAAMHSGKKEYDLIDLNGLPQLLWPVHCVQESKGAELTGAISGQKIAAIFRKGMDPETDSYSGFFDNGKRHDTGLAPYLKGLKISEVDVCGLAADFCVYYTAMDALDMGFKTTILLNATMPIDAETFEVKKESFVAKGGILA